MKKYIYITIVAIALSSCEDFLSKSPLDKLSEKQAFATEQNIQLYVNSFYVNGLPSAKSIFKGDQMSDICASRDVPDYLIGAFTSQQATGWNWAELRNINYFLDNFRVADVSDEKKNHYEGIARFFRAWFYFDKVKTFGNVPWYGKPIYSTNDPELYKTQDSRDFVMDSVLADINFACEHIEDTRDNSSSTVTRAVALALKSRICLFEGTFRKYHAQLGLSETANKWLKEAVSSAEQLIKSGKYSIYDTKKPTQDYRKLFVSESPISTEVIFASVFNNSLKRWHDSNWTYISSSYGGNISLNKSFVNTYLKIDGIPFTNVSNYNEIEFQNEVKDRDARLFQTIRMAPYKRSNGDLAPPDFTQAFTGYQILKHVSDDPATDTKAESYNSIPIIRFAEVLLNYAEAKAELGTFTQSDWDITIAKLRARAGISNSNTMPTVVDDYMKNNFFPDVNSPVLMEIRRERGVELACEGFRYDDLKRWKAGKLLEKEYNGIYVPALNQLLDLNEDGQKDVCFVKNKPAKPEKGVVYMIIDNQSLKLSEGDKGLVIWRATTIKDYSDYKYFYPIPYKELTLNPNLIQNKGWEI